VRRRERRERKLESGRKIDKSHLDLIPIDRRGQRVLKVV
jgi:hypothetical protein